jgi:uroporphyrinogen-III synthase
MKRLLVLRPEPGNSATAGRARALGLDPVQCPLFTVEGMDWDVPTTEGFDYLLLTSANAVRFDRGRVAELQRLPVLAVGSATADAARDAGLRVAHVGDRGVDELLAALPDGKRLLHLTGADHHRPAGDHAITRLVAYRTVPLDPTIPDDQLVALVHSARAGARLATLVRDRAAIAIIAISPAAAAACGPGWAALEVAERPDDGALLALAARLCQD